MPLRIITVRASAQRQLPSPCFVTVPLCITAKKEPLGYCTVVGSLLNLTIEEDCVRLGTYQRWHSHCLLCKSCGKDATPPPPATAKDKTTEKKKAEDGNSAPRITTARRPQPTQISSLTSWLASWTRHYLVLCQQSSIAQTMRIRVAVRGFRQCRASSSMHFC